MSANGIRLLSELVRSDQEAETFLDTDRGAEFAERYNEEAAKHIDDPVWLRAQAAVLAESLTVGLQSETSFNRVFNTRTVGAADEMVVRTRRGLKAFWTHRGGYIDESSMVEDEFRVPRDTIGFHIAEFQDKLETGFAQSLAQTRQLGLRRMEAEIYRRMISMLTEATAAGTPSYVDGTGALFTPELLAQTVADVFDEPSETGATPTQVSIIGRHSSLSQIMSFPGYDSAALEEIRKRGILGSWRGAKIVPLQNVKDDEGVSFLPDNQLYVVSGDCGLWVNFGPVKTKFWTEDAIDYVHLKSRRDVGGMVHRPNLVRRIQLPS